VKLSPTLCAKCMQGCFINWLYTESPIFTLCLCNWRCLLFFTESWWKHRYVFIIAATWPV